MPLKIGEGALPEANPQSNLVLSLGEPNLGPPSRDVVGIFHRQSRTLLDWLAESQAGQEARGARNSLHDVGDAELDRFSKGRTRRAEATPEDQGWVATVAILYCPIWAPGSPLAFLHDTTILISGENVNVIRGGGPTVPTASLRWKRHCPREGVTQNPCADSPGLHVDLGHGKTACLGGRNDDATGCERHPGRKRRRCRSLARIWQVSAVKVPPYPVKNER